ncbi:MAG: MATE family efflux transporter [Flavobacteriaceae bacterium]|nr:MATE family efflux transporter [Flavobacteriaceae bacterium]MDA7849533.1 MATE family efflux transporter [Flavobacteriaceae bacterium]MDG1310246.1 MATE family efflux transporter [Flavobacteriaceae bacterium]
METRISLKHINKLAVPAIIAGISEPILSLTDAAIVGHIPVNATESLAAVGIVTTFLSMLIWVLGQSRSAISSIISQYVGANKLEEVKNLPAQAITFILILSLLICLGTYPFSTTIFKLYNASGLLLDYSVSYYNIRIFGLPFTLYTFAVFGVFRGLQNTYYPMLIAITGAVINIILDVVLVYGIRDIFQPLYLKGAAIASVLAQFIMAALATYFLLKKTEIPLKLSRPINKEFSKFLNMIKHLIVRTLALNTALYFAARFATGYGNTYMAAYTIAINLWFFAAFAVDGYASAGNILSGKLFGAKNYQVLLQLSNRLIKYALIVGFIMGGIGALLYKPIGYTFTNDPKILVQFYDIFWIVLLMQPICALAFVFDGIFKGLGKMKDLRNVLLLATLFVFLPVIFILDYYGWKLYGVFTAYTLWMIARGIPLIIKFRKQFLPQVQNH